MDDDDIAGGGEPVLCEECIPKQKALLNVVLAIMRESDNLTGAQLQVQHLGFFLDALDQAEQTAQLSVEQPLPPRAGSTKLSGQMETFH